MWLINASLPCRKKCLISCLFKIIYSSIFKGKPACDKYENIHRGTVKHACLYHTFKGKLQKTTTRFLLYVFAKCQLSVAEFENKGRFFGTRKLQKEVRIYQCALSHTEE